MAEEFRRPDPDQLLSRIQSERNSHARGKLKIFMGYAAGVGKTYAMLEASHQRLAEGLDVVVGYVETHGRAETEALLRGMQAIPRKTVEYRGTQLTDMDVDAILARRPDLVLIDELAHTNPIPSFESTPSPEWDTRVPGMRHPKRFQDIEEILDRGISVYTTLNIQHLESLNDVIFQITGIKVHETVPDRVVDQAAAPRTDKGGAHER